MKKDRSGRILIIATSPNTKGGISAVVKAHQKGNQWKRFRIKWLYSHIDRGMIQKLFYFIRSWIQFIYLLPTVDLVHIHLSTYPSLLRKKFYFYTAKAFGKKVIVHFHSPDPAVLSDSKTQKDYYKMFSGSDLVIVLSEQWRRWIRESLGLETNIEVVYNPIGEIKPQPVEKKKYILFAGVLIHRKGYGDLIKAFAPVAKDYPEWKLIFAGSGEIEKAKSLVKDLSIQSQVEFRGWIDKEKKIKLFSEAEIFCLTSYAEGFPVAVLDAWTFGLPVICTPVGGLPDIVINKENALVYPAGDIPALTGCIRLMIEDKMLRNNIAATSYQLAQRLFHPDIINKQLEDIYEKLLAEK